MVNHKPPEKESMKTENLVIRCSLYEKLQIREQMKLRGFSNMSTYISLLIFEDGKKLKVQNVLPADSWEPID